MKILVAAVMSIKHMLNLEEVLMEEGHHNGKLFGAASLRHILDSLDVLGRTFEQSFLMSCVPLANTLTEVFSA